MFQNKRFLTRGVQAEIPMELQLFLWNCIDQFSEQPEYSQDYMIDIANPVNQKVYIIDDIDHSTILLAEEY